MPQYSFIRQGLRDHEHLKNNNRIEGSLSEALEAPLASLGTGSYLGEKAEVRCQLGSEDKELPRTVWESRDSWLHKKRVRRAEKARRGLSSLPNHLRSIFWMSRKAIIVKCAQLHLLDGMHPGMASCLLAGNWKSDRKLG